MTLEEFLVLARTRRSIRRFKPEPVDEALVEGVLEAGRWAPSGRNNQPWRFVVVRPGAILAPYTRYAKVLEQAPVAVAVFIHRPSMYHEVKDHQAVGACVQNMLLAAHAAGLGAVWLGEILARADEVRERLGVNKEHELMAVVAMGWAAHHPAEVGRMELDEIIIGRVEEDPAEWEDA